MKRPPPDNRLDWRDPNMPVIRDYTMRDGSKKIIVHPDYEHRYREMLMEMNRPSTFQFPNWRDDPTYNLAKKRRRR